ncbi:MAG TPA: glutamate--tRNA ligase [Planctomycetaceae bacterium]|nr:glutamate--tRNA ligase [Planctomycetaceae bacterium]
MSQVRTRFAPSPTGYMHIGGMRTALFCWLWARHNNGTFILRIDDTDQGRNVESALGPIFRAFRWLGLDWDEGPDVGGEFGPYYQSQRTDLYQAEVNKLLATGKAFKDFDTPEQIAADRTAAEKRKETFVNIRRSLDLTEAERAQFEAEGRPYVVRFLIPRETRVAIDDAVRGHVEWDCALIADPIIMRSNGSVLYNFATVVDDASMEITHVIRAEEHLTNTAVQALMHEALGNPLPVFAHIPFITAPGSTKKLSKRDLEKLRTSPQLKKMFDRADEVFPRLGLGDSTTLNPVMVEYYERLGYLPAGVLNALSRLGWSLDDKTELMSLQSVVENFTLDRIVKKPAALDIDKLISYQTHWMGQLSLDEKVDGCVPFLMQAGLLPTDGVVRPVTAATPTPAEDLPQPSVVPAETREYLGQIVTAIGDRLKIFSDILDYTEFFFADEALPVEEKGFRQKLVTASESTGLLQRIRAELASCESFATADLDHLVHRFVEKQGIKIGQIIHPLRLATTGRTVGIGLFEALSLIGRERCLRRIDVVLEKVAAAGAADAESAKQPDGGQSGT